MGVLEEEEEEEEEEVEISMHRLLSLQAIVIAVLLLAAVLPVVAALSAPALVAPAVEGFVECVGWSTTKRRLSSAASASA